MQLIIVFIISRKFRVVLNRNAKYLMDTHVHFVVRYSCQYLRFCVVLIEFIYKELHDQTTDTAAWCDILDTCGGQRGSEGYGFYNKY